MAKTDELKRLIADSLKINANNIDDNFILKTGRFRTSAGSVVLGNIVKKVYGKRIDCKNVTTFAELVGIVENEGENRHVESQDVSESTLLEGIGDNTVNEPIAPSSFYGKPVCGIDIQEIDIFPEVDDYWTDTFYIENFTKEEIAYCVTTSSPRHSFAGRWCVKEALHKCGMKYYDMPLPSIQVSKSSDGSIKIEILQNNRWVVLPFSCSLSHADNYAVGMVSGFEG